MLCTTTILATPPLPSPPRRPGTRRARTFASWIIASIAAGVKQLPKFLQELVAKKGAAAALAYTADVTEKYVFVRRT